MYAGPIRTSLLIVKMCEHPENAAGHELEVSENQRMVPEKTAQTFRSLGKTCPVGFLLEHSLNNNNNNNSSMLLFNSRPSNQQLGKI